MYQFLSGALPRRGKQKILTLGCVNLNMKPLLYRCENMRGVILMGNILLRKHLLVIPLVILMVLVLTSCGSNTPKEEKKSGETGKKTEQSASETKLLTIGTHPVGAIVNTFGNGVATVLKNHLSSPQFRVKPVSGPVEWLPMLGKGVDLGVLNNWDAKYGWLAKEDYEKPLKGKGAEIRLLTIGAPSYCGVLVAADSGIKTGKDLKGKRVVLNYTGSGALTNQAHAALANFGLKPEDVKVVNVSSAEPGIQLVIQGRADAAGTTNIGQGGAVELDSQKGALVLSFDPSPEAAKRLKEIYPADLKQLQPGPGMIGIKEPTYVMVYDFYLVGRADLDEETTYNIVKALWNYDSELGVVHPRLKDWTKEKFVNVSATIPYHPGAVKFYKEIGAWSKDMDQVQQNLLSKRQ